tara:strand:+ start:14691 stop:15242 length:552 start_codon:yes stop_codon:yes gene_type:complete
MIKKKIVIVCLFLSSLNLHARFSQGDPIRSKDLNESINHIGSLQFSLLNEQEFQALAGNCWVKMRGQNISGSDLDTHTGNRLQNLPNSLNKFIRDTGAGLGATQGQDWKGFEMNNTVRNEGNSSLYSHDPVYMGKSTSSFIGNLFTGYWAAPATGIGVKWDTSEIRPENLGVNIFVKINNSCD